MSSLLTQTRHPPDVKPALGPPSIVNANRILVFAIRMRLRGLPSSHSPILGTGQGERTR